MRKRFLKALLFFSLFLASLATDINNRISVPHLLPLICVYDVLLTARYRNRVNMIVFPVNTRSNYQHILNLSLQLKHP